MAEETSKPPRRKPVRRRPKLDLPNPIDIHVGRRLRLRRTMLGYSQERLAQMIGLTFQQVQKYERGSNRISASRLWELSRILETPVEYFFGEVPPETSRAAAELVANGVADAPPAPYAVDPAAKRESLEMVRAYLRIGAPAVRKRLFDLTRALAQMEEPGEADEAEA